MPEVQRVSLSNRAVEEANFLMKMHLDMKSRAEVKNSKKNIPGLIQLVGIIGPDGAKMNNEGIDSGRVSPNQTLTQDLFQ